jgi:phosphate-selective porin OprO/OprP
MKISMRRWILRALFACATVAPCLGAASVGAAEPTLAPPQSTVGTPDLASPLPPPLPPVFVPPTVPAGEPVFEDPAFAAVMPPVPALADSGAVPASEPSPVFAPASFVEPAPAVQPLEADAATSSYAPPRPSGRGGLSEADVERIIADYMARTAADSPRASTTFASQPKADLNFEGPKATAIGSDLKMNGSWKDGGQLETSDKAFKMKWRGRTQFDTVGYLDGSSAFFQGLGGNQGDTTVDFRRLRLGAEGVIYDQFDFAVELDFINSFNTNGGTNAFAPNNNLKNAFDRQFFGVPAPTDVWIGMHEIPLINNIRIGNVKPPNGLEHGTSSRFLDFMERSLNQDVFVGRFNNGFQPGILMWNYNEEQTFTWSSSLTANSYNVFAYEAGALDGCSRFTWTPWFDEESHGRYMLHLGFSSTARGCVDGQERLRARPSLRNGISQSWSNVVDTTIFYSTHETLLIPEFALLLGSLQLQGEYFGQWNYNVRTQGPSTAGPQPLANQGTAFFQGYYLQAGYFLTGEHREYEKKSGAFGRVVPYENFQLIKSGGRGPLLTRGAWQVLYRYTLVDLNDPALANVNQFGGGRPNVGGGTCYDHTIGLNHFLNPNMKIQYNYVYADRGAGAATPPIAGQPQIGGTSHGLGIRFALDF